MEKECKECGYPFLKGNEKFCPECGCKTLQNQSNNNGDNEAEDIGDNEVEDILRKTLDYIRKLIIILAYISSGIIFIGSISISYNRYYYYDTDHYWIFGLIVAVLNIIIWRWLAKLIWAVGMVFVNISTNIRIIKKNVATPK